MIFASRVWFRFGVWFVLLLAFAIQFFNLGARTFHGDEFQSIAEAKNLGLNPNGILYFWVMQFWANGGLSEWWLRTPSALFTVGTVAVVYRLALVLFDKRLGLIVGLLLATAPFVVEYSQQVRFYAFFLFASCLTYLAFVLFVQKPSRRRLVILVFANLLVIGAHFFGLLVVASQVLVAFITTSRLGSKLKLIVCGAVMVSATALALLAPIRSFVYEFMSRWTNPYGDPAYVVARGISLAQFAKIPFTFFSFVFGEHVYPLSIFVLLGLIVTVLLGGLGLTALWLHRREHGLALGFVVSLFVLPALVYLVFDSLSSPDLQGAAPRYLIFLLPIFYLIAAAGAQGKWSWLVIPLLLVNAGSLASYWFGDWAYTDDLVNWRQVTQWVGKYIAPQTIVLADGRAQGSADYYFPADWNRRGIFAYQTANDLNDLSIYSRIIMLSYNFHTDARKQATELMGKITDNYDQTAVWNKYPLFVYVYDRKTESFGTSRVDSNGSVNLPAEIYGLEFQDLRLPVPLAFDGQTIPIAGTFSLPGIGKQMTRKVQLAQPTFARRVRVLSNATGANFQTGTLLANLKLVGADGSTQNFPLRAGLETSAWNSRCQPNACSMAYTWRKRLALLGSESYSGSWQEFDASIFAIALELAQPTLIRALEIERVPSSGVLYVWGIQLQ